MDGNEFRFHRARPDKHERKLPVPIITVADPHNRPRPLPSLMSPGEFKLLQESPERRQEVLVNRVRRAWENRVGKQWPLAAVHREMRLAHWAHCEVYADPPAWIDMYEYSRVPRTVKDRYGRVLYMDRGEKRVKRIRPDEFGSMVRFEPVFPMHRNPAEATQGEKEERIAAFLNCYATTGLATASAGYVGVNYFQIMMWINTSEEWRAQLLLAQESAKLVMVDIGKQRAMAGDSGMIKFFIERDNPERYGRMLKEKGNLGELPDGVTQDSLNMALETVKKAQSAVRPMEFLSVSPQGEGQGASDDGLPAALVNQTRPVITLDSE